MKRISWIALAAATAFGAAQAAPAAKTGPHGGQTAVVAGHHDAELVISPAELTLYLTSHGKALVPADNAIKATIQEGEKKTELPLAVASEGDKVVGRLAQPLAPGAVIVLTGKLSGHALSARFVAK